MHPAQIKNMLGWGLGGAPAEIKISSTQASSNTENGQIKTNIERKCGLVWTDMCMCVHSAQVVDMQNVAAIILHSLAKNLRGAHRLHPLKIQRAALHLHSVIGVQ